MFIISFLILLKNVVIIIDCIWTMSYYTKSDDPKYF